MEFTKDIQFNIEPTAKQDLAITYYGFLKDSTELSIVYGFGENWEHTSEAKMEKTSDGYTVNIRLLNYDTFNFCFKNANQEWDNNSYCNYITSISPCVEPKFDIDALIAEILEPVISVPPITQEVPLQIDSKPIDLGEELTNILSEIDFESPTLESTDNVTLEQLLCGNVIAENPVELSEEKPSDSIIPPITETALVNVKSGPIISARQASKFYLWKKRVKLAFYKVFIKIPKLIFGVDKENQE